VDDEDLARQVLREFLSAHPEVEIVAECTNGFQAVKSAAEARPELIFLDIQMPKLDGFEVLELIGPGPAVIFVTAYDRHALRAFEVHAVDYVLKPVDPDRLRDAIDRAMRLRSLERGASLAERLERLLADRNATAVTPAPAAAPDRIVVAQGERRSFIDVSSIDWVEAYGNYVRVHAGDRSHVLRSTMTRMEHRLGGSSTPVRFIRVRRSALVNERAIVTVEPYGKGMFLLALRSGAKLVSSRYHQAGLRRLLTTDR